MTGTSEIIVATDAFLSTDPSIPGVPVELKALRCPYPTAFGALWFDDSVVSDADRADLEVCLPRVLRAIAGSRRNLDTHSAVLVGISQYASWSVFPSSEDDAYALAIATLFYVDDYGHGGMTTGKMDEFSRPYVCALLNTWLRPARAWPDLPGVVTLLRHMFGDAWCDLSLSSRVRDVVGGHRGVAGNDAPDRLVDRQRPPFLPGLCRGHDEVIGMDLPAGIGFAP
jgi:hypothetical protein